MFSGAEISALCREAALAALQKNNESCEVLRQHFDGAFMAVQPRTSGEFRLNSIKDIRMKAVYILFDLEQ